MIFSRKLLETIEGQARKPRSPDLESFSQLSPDSTEEQEGGNKCGGPQGAWSFRSASDQEACSPHLIGIIRKVDLVENLGGFVLDGLHFHQVWGVLSGPISENQERGWGAVRSLLGSWGHGEQGIEGTLEIDPASNSCPPLPTR